MSGGSALFLSRKLFMLRTTKTLRRIYDRTSGYCHICHRKLALKNYGIAGAKGAWEIEHSVAKALGGSDHGNNLYPAHVSYNRKKGILSTRKARGDNSKNKA